MYATAEQDPAPMVAVSSYALHLIVTSDLTTVLTASKVQGWQKRELNDV